MPLRIAIRDQQMALQQERLKNFLFRVRLSGLSRVLLQAILVAMVFNNWDDWTQMTQDPIKVWCFLGLGLHLLFAYGLFKLYRQVNLMVISTYEKLESSANMMFGMFGAYGLYLINNSKIYRIMKESSEGSSLELTIRILVFLCLIPFAIDCIQVINELLKCILINVFGFQWCMEVNKTRKEVML